MALTVEVVDAAVEPVPSGWDQFVHREAMTSAWSGRVLAALAQRPRSRWLALASDAGEVVAIWCGRHFAPATPLGPLPGLCESRLAIGGTLPGFVFADGLPAADRRAALHAIETALFRRIGWRCLGIAYRQIGDDESKLCDGVARLRISASPDMRIANHWDSMDGYFAEQPRHRRGRLRALFRSVSGNPRISASVSADGVAPAEASALALETLRRHRRRAQGPPPAYFRALTGQPGAMYLSYRDSSGRLLAFTLFFDDGTTLRSSLWGSLDPHGHGLPHLYFDHYLRLIAYTIEQGRESVYFGKGLAEIKERFGCLPVPRHIVIAPR